MSARLARYDVGRIILHLACMVRHGNVRWHWAGIVREVERWCQRCHPSFG
ncbi:MAG TPA: hypothetical protein VGA56_10520 [Opitutaceae bacterium]